MEQPYRGRANIIESIREFRIEVPCKKNWFLIVFMTAWLGGWLMGEVMALGFIPKIFGGNLSGGLPMLFVLFWLVAWTAGGFFTIRNLVWMIAGKEIISFGKTELIISKQALMFGKPKIYAISEVKNFSINPNVDNVFGAFGGANLLNTGNLGSLKFDYGLKTIKLANGIDEAEAKYLLEKIYTKNLVSK